MKKLYTTILIIALALFLSCDEQKAEDKTKKALDKTVDKATPKPTNEGAKVQGSNTPTNTEGEADSNPQGSGATTNTEGEKAGGGTPPPPAPTLTKPVLSSYRVRTGQVATFSKVKGHTYTLKEAISGVTLSDVPGDTTKKQISSTQAATGVIVVATLDDNTEESDPIEFVLIELTKPVLSSYRVRTGQVATFSKVEGHTYTLKDAISGVTLEVSDANTGRVSSTQAASNVIIVATLDGDTEESDPIEFVIIELTKPALSSKTVRVEYAATFTKIEGHTYTLKEAISGVTLSDVPGDTTKKQVSSTQAASNVIIVATLDGNTEESDPIEFISVYVANKAALQEEIRNTIQRDGATAKFNYIDTSDITDMSSLFSNNATFNGDISKWNTSKVTDMEYMFYGATSFNQPLNAWDVSSVEKMEAMFRDATSFNQPLNAWNVSKVKDMYRMFQGATSFNQPLNNWTVSSVTDMDYMFRGATAFNKPLNNWDVLSVKKMRHMFNSATSFNQDLTAWVDLSGRGTYNMFSGATAMQESYKPSWVE